MNKKKIITSLIIASFLLIGVVSAGLVSWLSNTVSADVEVKGPIFYLDNTNILSGKSESMYLKLNDDNVSGSHFKLSEDRFFSDSLGVESFYPMDFRVILNVKTFDLPQNETTNETIGSCSVEAEVKKVSNLGGSPEKLCDVIKIGIDNEGGYEAYEINCEGESDDEIDFNKGDRLELFLTNYCDGNASMNIKLQGESYINIVPKE
ncbi:MAG TPA: hypothetical protein VJ912_01580 [Candidatus Nanoarchaeia archaeon]|nr:hypothetical protein [Candidatus Nanoarchaeia archaeon]